MQTILEPRMTSSGLIANAYVFAITLALVGSAHAQTPAPIPLETPICARVPAARDWFFIAFFDQHSDQINARTQERLAEYAGLFVHHHISALKMNAFDDSSEAGDGDLGTRRARAVLAFFAKEGIPPEIMKIQDFGAKFPLVPTLPGVAEPQNRRIEFLPDLHSSDEELKEKRDCVGWLRQHADRCDVGVLAAANAEACVRTEQALHSWYLAD
jgi:hypothetical protein